MDDPVEIDRILNEGSETAAAIAEPIVAKTYDIVGFIKG
jgi:tryptophanyl-tRNA synthetase